MKLHRPIVKNKKTYKGPGIYIGRPSPLGNPYKIGRDGTRKEVIEKYDAWLQSELKKKRSRARQAIEMMRMQYEAGQKLILICWCAPKRCHGHIVRDTVVKYRRMT